MIYNGDGMIELGFLGTGGATATPERDNTAVTLNRNDHLVLIDCPGSAVAKIRKLGWDPRKVTALCITHIHPDHVYGLPAFVHSMLETENEVPLYGSQETVDFCCRLLDLFHLRKPGIGFRLIPTAVTALSRILMAGDLLCTALSVRHKPSSLGYQFEWGGDRRRLVYSGDTAVHPPLFRSAGGADYLVHDCSVPSRLMRSDPNLSRMHTSARELGIYAREAGIHCLIPCHFFAHLGVSAAEIESEIRESFKGKLIMPGDFDHIRLVGEASSTGKE